MAKITNNQETRNKQSTIINKQNTNKRFGYWFLKFGYCLVIVSCIIVSFHAEAAKLNLVSTVSEFGVGQQFQVDLFLNAEGEDINAIEGALAFPADILELKEIRDGNSILNFWVKKPETENGRIVFSGIVAGGYRGENGPVFSMIFEAKKEGEGAVEVKEGKVLLNDGKGTETELRSENYKFQITNSKEIQNSKFKIQNLEEDKAPPEEFKPEIAQSPEIFDGKWFLVFWTQDKQSGIDHYEVKEEKSFEFWSLFENWNLFGICPDFVEDSRLCRRNLDFGFWESRGDKWAIAESPYVLRDQNLRSYIYVKAVDKAGNAKISVISPRNPQKWYENTLMWSIIIIGIIIALFVFRKIRKKRISNF